MSNISLGDQEFDVLDLRQLVDIEQLQRIQDDFALETGLAMITVDAMGSPVTEASQFSALCQLLRRDPKIRKLCYSCDAHGGLQSQIEGKPVVYQCHAGLVDFSVSITMGSRYLGAVLAGQVLLARGQDSLKSLVVTHDTWRDDPEIEHLTSRIRTVEIDKLHEAADAIVRLTNDTLTKRSLVLGARVSAGPYLGRLPLQPSSDDTAGHAPLTTGRGKVLPLIPIESAPRIDATRVVDNLHSRNVAGNFELLGEYLDQLLPGGARRFRGKIYRITKTF